MDNITTENGDLLVAETVTGIAEASTLNDISVVTINKEDFSENPTTNGWLIGTDWQWDSTNEYIEII